MGKNKNIQNKNDLVENTFTDFRETLTER